MRKYFDPESFSTAELKQYSTYAFSLSLILLFDGLIRSIIGGGVVVRLAYLLFLLAIYYVIDKIASQYADVLVQKYKTISLILLLAFVLEQLYTSIHLVTVILYFINIYIYVSISYYLNNFRKS
jgi:hypothetical protein